MRERCAELGIPTIDHRLVSSYEEAVEFYRSLGGDAIIKPIDSSGSRGGTKITSEEELRAHVDEAAGYALAGEVIIERFIEGDEFEVDSIAAGGHSKTLMYADLESFDIPNVFASTTRLYPSVAEPETVEKLLNLNQKIMDSFGLKVGLSHSEYMRASKTGEIYLIEAAARGGGTYISSHIAQLQSGLNTAEFLVKTALGEITEVPEFEADRCHCGYVAFYLPQGEVVSVDGLDEVENLEYVAQTTLHLIRQGMVTKAFEDKRNRHAVILSASTRQELLDRIEHIRSTLNIKIKTPEGIRGPIWH